MTIALATCAQLPDLDADDQRLYDVLRARGHQVARPVWNDPAVDWSAYELVVIRSTWDYVPQRDAYVNWAQAVAARSTLWNPAPLIAWNTSKIYLRQLEAQGTPTVPTLWLAAGSTVDFGVVLDEAGWADVVIKPVIGASGKDTHRVHREAMAGIEPLLQALLATRDVMIQPFMHRVATEGEQSFLFIDGQFSHAVVKRPAPTEFRVQEQFGGLFEAFAPTDEELTFAQSVMARLPWPTLYGRVDVMRDDSGRMCLSELELTEPSMYLQYGPGSAERFAEAIERRLALLVS